MLTSSSLRPRLPLTRPVTLGTSLNLSEPQHYHLYSGHHADNMREPVTSFFCSCHTALACGRPSHIPPIPPGINFSNTNASHALLSAHSVTALRQSPGGLQGTKPPRSWLAPEIGHRLTKPRGIHGCVCRKRGAACWAERPSEEGVS